MRVTGPAESSLLPSVHTALKLTKQFYHKLREDIQMNMDEIKGL